MLTIVLITALTASPSASNEPPEHQPATRLALDLAEAMATRVEALALQLSELTQAEEEAIREALTRTQLFTLSPTAPHTLTIKRMSDESILVSLAETGGPRIWVSQLSWKTLRARHDALAREQTYQRESVRVEAFNRASGLGFWLGTGLGRPIGSNNHRGHLQLSGATPLILRPELDWRIVRGAATVIDELQLAQLAGNTELEETIRTTRADRRRTWWMGFGGTSLVGLAAGSIINWQAGSGDDSNLSLRTLGTSLVLLGVAAGVTALFYPSVDKRHVLSAQQAQEVCDRFNRMLHQGSGAEKKSKSEGIAP